MFEQFKRRPSKKENDASKTGDNFRLATPGSSLDFSPIRPDNRLAVEAAPRRQTLRVA